MSFVQFYCSNSSRKCDLKTCSVRKFDDCRSRFFESSPHGMELGTQCGLYSSAHTSQTEPGLSVSMIKVNPMKPLPGLPDRKLLTRNSAYRGGG